jgi:transcriptional regulator with XRE-family HTH domain
MKERISEFLRAENKSSAQFAEEIGVQPSAVSHVLSGRNNPSLDFVLKMLNKYPYISVEWLLFARGVMYKDLHEHDLFSQSLASPASSLAPDVPGKAAEDLQGSAVPLQGPISGQYPERSGAKVARIVWFWDDNTFTEYKPA